MQEQYNKLLNNHNYFIRKNKSGVIVQSIYIKNLIHYYAGDIKEILKSISEDPQEIRSADDMRELIQELKSFYKLRIYAPDKKRTRSEERKRTINYKIGVSFTNRGRRAGNLEEWTI